MVKFFVVADELLKGRVKSRSIRVTKDAILPETLAEFNHAMDEVGTSLTASDVKLVLMSHGDNGRIDFCGKLIDPGLLIQKLKGAGGSSTAVVGAGAGGSGAATNQKLLLDLFGCSIGTHVKALHGVPSKTGVESAGEYKDIPDNTTVIVNSGKYFVGTDAMYHVALGSASKESASDLDLFLERMYTSAETTKFIAKKPGKPIAIFKQTAPKPTSAADLTDDKIRQHLHGSAARFLQFYSENLEAITAERMAELMGRFDAALTDETIANYRNFAYLVEIEHDKLDYARLYVEAGASPDPRVGSRIISPIPQALSPTMLQFLLDETSAEIITPDATAMFKNALHRGDVDTLASFLRRRPGLVNEKIDGETPWRIASKNPKVRELFVRSGVTLRPKDAEVYFQRALLEGDIKMAAAFVESGRRTWNDVLPGEKRATPLFFITELMAINPHVTLYGKWEAMARYMLEHGADPKIPTAGGETVLMMASKAESISLVISLLRDHHVDFDAEHITPEGRRLKAVDYTESRRVRGLITSFPEHLRFLESRAAAAAATLASPATVAGSADLATPRVGAVSVPRSPEQLLPDFAEAVPTSAEGIATPKATSPAARGVSSSASAAAITITSEAVAAPLIAPPGLIQDPSAAAASAFVAVPAPQSTAGTPANRAASALAVENDDIHVEITAAGTEIIVAAPPSSAAAAAVVPEVRAAEPVPNPAPQRVGRLGRFAALLRSCIATTTGIEPGGRR